MVPAAGSKYWKKTRVWRLDLGSNLQPCHEAPFLSLPFAAASLVTPQRWPDFRQGETTVENVCQSVVGGKASPQNDRDFLQFSLVGATYLSSFNLSFVFFFFSSSNFWGRLIEIPKNLATCLRFEQAALHIDGSLAI